MCILLMTVFVCSLYGFILIYTFVCSFSQQSPMLALLLVYRNTLPPRRWMPNDVMTRLAGRNSFQFMYEVLNYGCPKSLFTTVSYRCKCFLLIMVKSPKGFTCMCGHLFISTPVNPCCTRNLSLVNHLQIA